MKKFYIDEDDYTCYNAKNKYECEERNEPLEYWIIETISIGDFRSIARAKFPKNVHLFFTLFAEVLLK